MTLIAPRQLLPQYALTSEWPRLFRFTYEQYYQLTDLGFFRDKRVELIEGEIFDMAPQKDLHTAATLLVQYALQRALPDLLVRTQMPLHVAANSELEPDVSIVTGTIRDYVGTGHPTTALLVVEVSDTTLTHDRTTKASLYAAAGIKDYWVLNLRDRCLELFRQPIEDSASPSGWRYSSITMLKSSDAVSPFINANSSILVANILP